MSGASDNLLLKADYRLVTYTESNLGEHERAIDQQSTDDQDKQNHHHSAHGLNSHAHFPPEGQQKPSGTLPRGN
jgi:hypothetical protein